MIKSPLKLVWDVLSTFGTVLGLINFFNDLVSWKSIIPQLIDTYQKLVYFPFHFFELGFNSMVVDYFFIGSICGAAFVKAIDYGEMKGILNTRGYPKIARIVYFLLYLLSWPLAIIIGVKQLLFGFEDPGEIELKKRFFQWLLTSVIIFIMILLANIFLL